MRVDEVLERAQDAITGRRVFGTPVEQDGTVVVPAAEVIGGGGGGGGQDGDGQEGIGGGFGLRARPVGAYVIEGGRVRWRPAVDVTGLAGIVAGVVVVAFVCRWRMTVARARGARCAGEDGRATSGARRCASCGRRARSRRCCRRTGDGDRG